ncbi:MAG: Fic family protein [Erysipelotrichaceae bacterium]|nr:Fic family protein [Erysipelotrichaceae bacterium]
MNSKAGTYIKNLEGELAYESFVPTFLPLNFELNLDDEIYKLLINANKNIASLNDITTQIPDLNLFISMYLRKEALLSSQIEGTQASLNDILDPSIETNTNLDVDDVINYIKAYEYGIDRLKTLPICCRFMKEIHKILLDNTRGQEKNPGEFRKTQNWIGGRGSTLKNAVYVPPNVEDMLKAMNNLENYINNNEEIDHLIKVALIHYQFETIHPFLDGNGRVGRLLIILYLIENNVLESPSLYISYYLKNNRIEYYDRISEVRKQGNYEQWIKFFLTAIIESCDDAIKTIKRLIVVRDNNISKINKSFKANKSIVILFDYLQAHPIIEIGKTAKALNLSFNTVSKAIEKLISINVLVQIDNNSRNRLFVYEEYMNILKQGTE